MLRNPIRVPGHMWVATVLCALAFTACTSSDADTTTTVGDDPSPTTTTTTISPRQGLVPDPASIMDAAARDDLGSLAADRHQAAAMWGVFDEIPLEFMVPETTTPRPMWDHSALSRVVDSWDELDVVARSELIGAVDGLEEFVARPGFSGLQTGQEGCVPTGTDVWICVGASVSDQPVPDLPLEAAAEVVRPWIRDAALAAWPRFDALFDKKPSLVKVYLSNLHADGGYTYGVVPDEQPEGAGGICHVYVDVLVPTQTDDSVVHVDVDGVPDGVPLEDQIRATTVHEMFHCFQKVSGWSFDRALWEGSATWSEHHVYPEANTELPWMTTWISDPTLAFGSRLYDTSFAFLFVDQHHGPEGVVDALRAASAGALVRPEAAFADEWHDVSISAWNMAPVKPLVNDGGALIAAEVANPRITELEPDETGALAVELEPFSRDIQAFEFRRGLGAADLAGFARLALDLSAVPSDVRISALTETAAGWGGPVDLVGLSDYTFCRAAVGSCNDVDPATIGPFMRIALIVTNVDNGTEAFDIPWDTHNPRLDGSWVRVDGPFLTNPGATAPYGIVGTTLDFNESQLVMVEDTAGYSLKDSDPGWTCTFAGQYFIGADPTYELPNGGDVDGTVQVDATVGEGETFTNDCVLESFNGSETSVSGFHIPVVANPDGTFGFEIRDNDTLWVYSFQRIYVYERVD